MENCLWIDNHILVVAKNHNIGFEEFKQNIIKQLTEKGMKSSYLESLIPICAEASGLVVFALSSKAKDRLEQQIAEQDFMTKYLAVCVGSPRERNGLEAGHIHLNTKTGLLERIPQLNQDAMKMYDRWMLLEQNSKISLICIEGGLKHSDEVRFVMASAGSPIFGDTLYKGDSLAKDTNMALTLTEVKFIHPITDKNLIFRTYPALEKKPWSFFNVEKHLKI